jgi:anti-anti-sigma factor
MAVAVWSYGKVRILVLTDDSVSEGGQLPLPASHRGLPALEGLRMALEAILGQGCRAILLDMTGVTYLDSADLGELFSCRKRLLPLGADLALLHVSGRARAVVEMVDINRVFRMFDDEAEALAALGG